MSEFYVNWTKVKFWGCIQSFMLPWKLPKRQILPVNQNLSSVYMSPAKFQLVSCNLSLAVIWQMTYTHKLPKLCSATLNLYYAQKLLRKAKNCSKSQKFLKRWGKPMNCCCFLFLLFLYFKTITAPLPPDKTLKCYFYACFIGKVITDVSFTLVL